jgi:hypothetical protein
MALLATKTTLYGVVFQELNGPLLTSAPGSGGRGAFRADHMHIDGGKNRAYPGAALSLMNIERQVLGHSPLRSSRGASESSSPKSGRWPRCAPEPTPSIKPADYRERYIILFGRRLDVCPCCEGRMGRGGKTSAYADNAKRNHDGTAHDALLVSQ